MTENELVKILWSFAFDLYSKIKEISSGKLLLSDYFKSEKAKIYSKYAKAILKKLEEERRDSREKIIEVLKKYITIEPISKVSNPGLILYKQIADEILSIEKQQHKCI
jgi:hypothetical protein